ncbi:MAG: o-succinylbenzoate synthase, partial [Deltaproteobacteria bacterium]|nr:o-succinylbenzoate synthase [Deltaproteobacteria bacterium]
MELVPFAIPFRQPFVTSSVAHRVREGLLVRLIASDGVGIGEASPPPSLGRPAVQEAVEGLATGSDALPPWARFGLETARLDLEGRRRGIPVAALHAPDFRRTVEVNATLASVEAAAAAEQAAAAREAGIRTVKLKVGVGSPAADAERVAAVRAAVGPDVAIRVDANGAWSEREAEAALARIAPYGIEYVEQPVARGHRAALARLRSRSGVRIAADEEITGSTAAAEVIAAQAADVLILKPARVGGASVIREIARLAHDAGLSVVVTTTLDSSVAVVAALHIAAALQPPPRACGL